MTDPNEKTAWITGAGGLIGNYLAQTAGQFSPACRVRALNRSELDLLDFSAVRNKFLADKPGLVIHCAALSQSPACQKNPALAKKLNVEVTELLADLATEVPFIFFSTDLVFDGRKGNYIETDPPNPLSVYAETKVAAEKIVLANPRHTVIRTSLNGGVSPAGDRGFNEQLRAIWQRGETMKLFIDEFRNPLPAVITARAAWELIQKKAAGLFHVAGGRKLSRWEIGNLIAARWPQLNARLEAGSLKDYQGAPRPPDTSLNCARAQALLSFRLPGLDEWLAANPREIF